MNWAAVGAGALFYGVFLGVPALLLWAFERAYCPKLPRCTLAGCNYRGPHPHTPVTPRGELPPGQAREVEDFICLCPEGLFSRHAQDARRRGARCPQQPQWGLTCAHATCPSARVKVLPWYYTDRRVPARATATRDAIDADVLASARSAVLADDSGPAAVLAELKEEAAPALRQGDAPARPRHPRVVAMCLHCGRPLGGNRGAAGNTTVGLVLGAPASTVM